MGTGTEAERQRPPEALGDYRLSADDKAVLERVFGFTMTSIKRQIALILSVRHVVQKGIAGCIVECGVWRGGSSMAAALTLIQEGSLVRDLYLFDTFTGMTSPTDVDRTSDGTPARVHLDRDADRTSDVWAIAAVAEVRQNMAATGYPQDRVHLIEGPVEATIPPRMPPGPIAVLRLDTDWYESTKHELEHLFPLLAEGGILIVDDYGHWEGARKAVDEYFAAQPRQFRMISIDFEGRMIIKQ